MAKKILFFVGGSYVSGMEIITLHLIKELIKKGFTVHCIISGWNDGVFKKRLQELNVSFDEVKLGWIYFRKPLWTLDSLVHYPGALRKIRRVLKQFNPDIIHYCYYGVVVMLYPWLKKTGVYALHETHLPTLKHRIFYRLLNRKVKRFTAVSAHIGRVLQRLEVPAKKIQVIYNGVPRGMQPGEPMLRKSTGSKLIFGIIGQVVLWKGHQTLVEAVTLLVQEGRTDFEVYIFGNDNSSFAGELKQQITGAALEKYFTWKGFVSNQDSIYEAVDVVVVPSLSEEPCSLTVIEAMMHEKAVIVSNRGGNPELVNHNKTGLVFAAGNAVELKGGMAALLTDETLRLRFAHAAFLYASSGLTVERMGIEYEELYNNLLNSNAD